MASKRVTLKDIAQVYGYSVNTVSKALRNSDELPEETRIKIQQTAKEMGYIRNRQASSLRSGHSHIIAVVVNDIRNIYFSSLINEIEIHLRQAGYDMMIFCTHTEVRKKERSIETIQVALSQSVDGILYFPYWNDHKTLEYMENSNVPFVLVSRWTPDIHTTSVRCDDYSGGRLAASHLLGLGHRKFTYASGPSNNSAQYDRMKGFLDVLREADIPASDIQCLSCDEVEQAEIDGDYISLLKPDTYKAIFAFNDEIAYRILKSLKNTDLRIPEDLSIVGCDALCQFASYCDSLTSIACDSRYSLARESVQLILNRIHHPDDAPREIILPVELYDGHTTMQL